MGYQKDKNATTAAISTKKKKIDPGFPMPTGVVVAKQCIHLFQSGKNSYHLSKKGKKQVIPCYMSSQNILSGIILLR